MKLIEILNGDRDAYKLVFKQFCESMNDPKVIQDKRIRIMTFLNSQVALSLNNIDSID